MLHLKKSLWKTASVLNRSIGSVVPVYVVWVKSYVNCFFRFPCAPMVVSVNKLYCVPQRLVSGSVSMFWNRGILSAWYLVDCAIWLVWERDLLVWSAEILVCCRTWRPLLWCMAALRWTWILLFSSLVLDSWFQSPSVTKAKGSRWRRELWIDVSSPGLFLMAWWWCV